MRSRSSKNNTVKRTRAPLGDGLKADKSEVNNEQRLRADGRVHIFTDGSANVKDKTGGWGCLLVHGAREKRLSGADRSTTIGAMELMGILMALRALKRSSHEVVVYSDSQYVVNAVTIWHRGWADRGWVTSTGRPVKHVQIIQEIVALAETHNVVFRWVKGHAGNWGNEIADELATTARRTLYNTP